jgi:hypothetical protein
VLAVTNVFGDDCSALVVVANALAPTVQRLAFFVVIVQRADPSALADTPVSQSSSLVMLVPQVKRLQEQKNWNARNSNQEEQLLDLQNINIET